MVQRSAARHQGKEELFLEVAREEPPLQQKQKLEKVTFSFSKLSQIVKKSVSLCGQHPFDCFETYLKQQKQKQNLETLTRSGSELSQRYIGKYFFYIDKMLLIVVKNI